LNHEGHEGHEGKEKKRRFCLEAGIRSGAVGGLHQGPCLFFVLFVSFVVICI